jgi:hypothetical protein
MERMFYKVGSIAVDSSQVVSFDFSEIENLQVTLKLSNGDTLKATEIDALELAMLVKPSVLENKRLRWPKFVWFVHNMVGHPLMQILALFGAYKLAFKVHDGTVPSPLGVKQT